MSCGKVFEFKSFVGTISHVCFRSKIDIRNLSTADARRFFDRFLLSPEEISHGHSLSQSPSYINNFTFLIACKSGAFNENEFHEGFKFNRLCKHYFIRLV